MTVEEVDREEEIPEVEEVAQEEDRAGANRAVEDSVDHSSNSDSEGKESVRALKNGRVDLRCVHRAICSECLTVVLFNALKATLK